MANLDNPGESCDVDEMLKVSHKSPDLIIDGINFGRGDAYYNENTSTQLKHTTIKLKCWRIVNESLEQIEDEQINNFYDTETYIIQWDSVSETFRFNTDDVLSKNDNTIYFYWKGDKAPKGYSPLPDCIEKDNPPVERIAQWAEPPAFLQLFSGTFIVHIGTQHNSSDNPRLYILRGEMEKEIHLFEVPLKRESLRSRTSLVLHYPKEKKSIVWYGAKANPRSKIAIRKATEKLFGSEITETNEGSEDGTFLNTLPDNGGSYFVYPPSKVVDYTPRLFYFNKITGSFLASEIECSHKSSHLTPFPFLQSHLYTAAQPATFLLDDNNELWMWQGWEHNEDSSFKSECFVTAISYAKQKSKLIKELVRVHKVVAGFEPDNFTNLFPTWNKREDVVQLQMKDGVLPNTNPLIEVISHEETQEP